jgi:hypothetical protein
VESNFSSFASLTNVSLTSFVAVFDNTENKQNNQRNALHLDEQLLNNLYINDDKNSTQHGIMTKLIAQNTTQQFLRRIPNTMRSVRRTNE